MMAVAVGQGCDCDSVLGQDRLRSNHGCLRRRRIEAMTIRNQREVEVSAAILIDALTVIGLKDVTRCAISARETSVLSALAGA